MAKHVVLHAKSTHARNILYSIQSGKYLFEFFIKQIHQQKRKGTADI